MTTTEQPTDQRRRRRPWIVEVYSTDVGKKYAMAISGIIGLLFIFFHMIGNLHAFEGAAELNEYGEGLRDIGEPLVPRTLILWLFLRLPLVLALAVHVHAAYSLARQNQRARAGGYEMRNYYAANYASRTMGWAGVIILLFLAWHLADLTWGVGAVNPDFERGEVYQNLVASLERWPVTLLYVVAQGALALHIWHGAWSMFQSLGVNNPRYNHFRRTFATAFTIIVVGGFLLVPISVQLGIIG
ncbi:MAG TPA: succinate dehydrogenase cytochrome b subunit [Acidimicrobiia bacterium]|nr:succinate dehydrogenase cytochrome b subunit [Acidimicrobiia bacterium]